MTDTAPTPTETETPVEAGVSFYSVFQNPDFNPYIDLPAIGVPDFYTDRPAAVLNEDLDMTAAPAAEDTTPSSGDTSATPNKEI